MRPINVLLVDDDQSIRSMLRIAFSVQDGIGEVREADDGGTAIDICEDFEPDVIFLDYWMPQMDGETAAAVIHQMHPSARIFAFSGVLDEKPRWADHLLVKGDMPDLDKVIDLARAELSV